MKINFINPNTRQELTQAMALSARQVAQPDTAIQSCCPQQGRKSIESAFDASVAAHSVLEFVAQGEQQQVHAHIIACFGDPGLDAARELASAPVIGITQAAFQLASLVCYRFGIVTTIRRTIPFSEQLLVNYGYQHRCSGIRAADIKLHELNAISNNTYQLLKYECLTAIQQDGADGIVLGCGAMSYLAPRLSEDLRVPVIDGVAAAVKAAESLYQLKLTTSKAGQYDYPANQDDAQPR